MATYDHQKDNEKVSVAALERIESDDSAVINDARIQAFTEAEQKKIWRRVDYRLVLPLGFMYAVSLMDRTNTGIAVVAGMGVDLALVVGERYSIIVLVFFFTYVLLQPPATVVLRKVGPRIFLPLIVALWGTTMIGFGFVKTWSDLIPLRIVLGIFEAGFFPGCAYLLSCWYPRYHLQKRNAVFYLIGSMSSAFSGILAYGFSHLAGHGSGPSWMGQHHVPTKANHLTKAFISPGLAGWRWIFILQGLLTVIIAFIGWIFIVDFPELCTRPGISRKFLNQQEADFVVAVIEKDRHDAIPAPFNIKEYLKNACDSKVWGFAWLFGLTTTMTYAIAYFLPIILNEGFGYDAAASQCLIAPPYLFAAIIGFAEAWYSDKWHVRGPFIILNGVLAIIGLALLGFVKVVGVRYFGVFLATAAANANIPCVLSFQANNIRGQWKRALCSATLVGAGGIGGIVGSTVFRTVDKPGYVPGMIACLVAATLIVVITLVLQLKFSRANKRAAAGGKVIEGLEGFRYTL